LTNRRREEMGRLKGTLTEKNLLGAFAGESQARNRYTYFAKQAKKDGYEQIAAIFEETANHEKEHAKRFFAMLEGGDVEITATFPAGVVGPTLDNLKASAMGENHEWTALYPEFARIARGEGFADVAVLFESISKAEAYHEARYKKLAANIEAGKVFKKDETATWRCRNCGYNHEGPNAPAACPACAHPLAHFELVDDNY